MQVILTKDVPKLGYRGDIKHVKTGYFRNYLLPRGLGELATTNRIKQSEKIREQRVIKLNEQIAEAKKMAEVLQQLTITFRQKVTSKNKLYGSIAEKDLVEAIKQQAKIELPVKAVKLAEHIKTTGDFSIPIHLSDDVHTAVKVSVIKE